MLEKIREGSQGWIAKTILGLVILTFAVAGIGSYTNSVDTSVAEVNGVKITQADYDKAYQTQRNRMAQQFGDMFETLSADPNYMANFRQGVLDNLINETLIDQNSYEMGIRVSNEMIKKTIREMPEFQTDGAFDNNRYLAIINQAGFFQPSDFRDYLRTEMTRRQLTQSLVGSEFSLPYQTDAMNALQSQQRDIRYAVISASQFESTVEVTDAEIDAYYQANQAQFRNQEKVKLDYVAIDVAAIANSINVTDADVESYYNENIDSFKAEEQRRISHILVEFGDDQSASKAKIDDVLARLNNGEDFAELAKTMSDDTFSGENGGDLEWLERGVMDEAFEEAAYALANVGDYSEVVESSFGYHIIALTDFKAESIKALAEIKEELRENISTEQAQEQYFELQQELARLSFEFPDSLEDAAGGINQEVKTTDWLSRGGNLPPFNEPALIEAAFSDLVLQDQVNSDIIDVNDDLAIVVRLNEYQAATVKPLTEVQDGIKATLVSQKATEAATNSVNELLTKLNSGEDITEALTALGASFEVQAGVGRYGSAVDANISKEAFVLPHPTEGVVSAATVTLTNGDLALVQVEAVKASDTPIVNPNAAEQQTSLLAQSAYQSYVDSLKVDAKIVRRQLSETAGQRQF